MDRDKMLSGITNQSGLWDMVIIGGGASGLGTAVDAASRGYKVLLVEQSDFGNGTSSRSTKLAHGGVRYLQQGNISLVLEALKERGIMRRNAPHLVKNQAFVLPAYDWWEGPFYSKIALDPGEVEERFGEHFNIEILSEKLNQKGFPLGWKVYLMERKGVQS